MTRYEFRIAAKNAIVQAVQELHDENLSIAEIYMIDYYSTLMRGRFIDKSHNDRLYEVAYDPDGKDVMLVNEYELTHSIFADLDITVPSGEER